MVFPPVLTKLSDGKRKTPSNNLKIIRGGCLLFLPRKRETEPMCHAFVSVSRFYRFLFQIDLDIATEVQRGGCLHCGGTLHVSCYPRKPRGIRAALDESYEYRLSFCCRGWLSASQYTSLGAFSWQEGLPRCDCGSDHRHGARSYPQTPQATDRESRSVAPDYFTLASMVAGNLSKEFLLAVGEGELYATD